MRMELLQRQDNLHKRRIKAAKFPIHKTIDEFDLNRLENVSKAYIAELVNCDFINQKTKYFDDWKLWIGENTFIDRTWIKSKPSWL